MYAPDYKANIIACKFIFQHKYNCLHKIAIPFSYLHETTLLRVQ